jgi:hypothetical protein
MNLTYNNPERAKERSQCVPLTMEEIEYIPYFLNTIIGIFEVHLSKSPSGLKENYNNEYLLLQRLLDEHENLKHLSAVIGGYEGYLHLKQQIGVNVTCDCEVNYEIVKP